MTSQEKKGGFTPVAIDPSAVTTDIFDGARRCCCDNKTVSVANTPVVESYVGASVAPDSRFSW
jgi:hypothetical protein